MKKFVEAKAPMNMLKYKMKIKAEAKPDFKVFYDEIETLTKEQNTFVENLEFQMAVAEAIDPVQDGVFAFSNEHVFYQERRPAAPLLSIGVFTYDCSYIHMYVEHTHTHSHVR